MHLWTSYPSSDKEGNTLGSTPGIKNLIDASVPGIAKDKYQTEPEMSQCFPTGARLVQQDLQIPTNR
jgi:hypothetical protein